MKDGTGSNINRGNNGKGKHPGYSNQDNGFLYFRRARSPARKRLLPVFPPEPGGQRKLPGRHPAEWNGGPGRAE